MTRTVRSGKTLGKSVKLALALLAVGGWCRIAEAGSVAKFNGVSGSGLVGPTFKNITNFTFAVWAKNPDYNMSDQPDGDGNGDAYGVFFSQGALGHSGVAFYVQDSAAEGANRLALQTRDASSHVSRTFYSERHLATDNRWHLYVVTHSQTTTEGEGGAVETHQLRRIWLDGEIVAETDESSGGLVIPGGSDKFAIGCAFRSTLAQYPLKGYLSSATLWDVVLDETEIRSLLKRRPAASDPRLVASWPLATGGTSEKGTDLSVVNPSGKTGVEFIDVGDDVPFAEENVVTLNSNSQVGGVTSGCNYPNLRTFSLCAWTKNVQAKSSSSETYGAIASQGALSSTSGFALHLTRAKNSSTHTLVFQIRKANATENEKVTVSGSAVTALVNDNSFHFLCATVDWESRTMRLYIDGVLQAERGDITHDPSTLADFAIGGRYSYVNGTAFDHSAIGCISQVSLWNKALTEGEVRSMYLSGSLVGCESGLLGYWPLDDGADATVLRDCVPNGHDGTYVAKTVRSWSTAASPFGGTAARLFIDDVGDTNLAVRVQALRVAPGEPAATVSVAWGRAADALVNTNALGSVSVTGDEVSGVLAPANLKDGLYLQVLLAQGGVTRASAVQFVESDGFPWADYQKLEYIESTGTQLLDTGYSATAMTRLSAEMELTNLDRKDNTSAAFLGAVEAGNTFQLNFGASSAAKGDQTLYFWIWKPYDEMTTEEQKDCNRRITVQDKSYFLQRQSLYVDCNANYAALGEHWVNTMHKKAAMTKSLKIFGNDLKDGTLQPFTIAHLRLYSCQLRTGAALLRDFVPCCERRGLRRAGFYDLVNGVFHPNILDNGTDFVRGPKAPVPSWAKTGLFLILK